MLVAVNQELKSFEDLARSFAVKELSNNRDVNDRYPFGPFWGDIVEKAYEVGLLGATLPEECGGIGQGMGALCVIIQNISEVDASMAAILLTNAFAQEIILQAGAKDVLTKISESAAGASDMMIAFPMYENPALKEVLVTAKKEGDGYVLSGLVEFAALGNIARYALIPARIEGSKGYGYFLIDSSVAGIVKSEPIFSLGLHACPAVDLKLKNVKATLIGDDKMGDKYFQTASGSMSVAVAAMASGIMKGSFADALAYSQERQQGGWEIINWSNVRKILADMAIQVKISEMSVSQAVQSLEAGDSNASLYCRAAALFLNDVALNLTSDGIQIFGGNGYMKDYGQEKRFRDANQLRSMLGMAPMRKLSLIKDMLT
ncbi:MAG: acyl-CoA dehydrogenase family protein [Smithella sp.]|jgi:alkylation response protein AidB-like acyl-CoA dehydrogenase